jgi:hypothetical protein
MYTETMMDTSTKYKYTRNNRKLRMSINDKDSYEERQMNTSTGQIDKYHNRTNIYIYMYMYVCKIYNLMKFANS